eukprot:5870347-Prymnesium_polylepis.1
MQSAWPSACARVIRPCERPAPDARRMHVRTRKQHAPSRRRAAQRGEERMKRAQRPTDAGMLKGAATKRR